MLHRMNSVLPLDKSEMLHLGEQHQGDHSQARLVTLSGPSECNALPSLEEPR